MIYLSITYLLFPRNRCTNCINKHGYSSFNVPTQSSVKRIQFRPLRENAPIFLLRNKEVSNEDGKKMKKKISEGLVMKGPFPPRIAFKVILLKHDKIPT